MQISATSKQNMSLQNTVFSEVIRPPSHALWSQAMNEFIIIYIRVGLKWFSSSPIQPFKCSYLICNNTQPLDAECIHNCTIVPIFGHAL